MDVAGGLSLVQTVIGMLGSPIWTEIESALGVESQLQKLKDTMSTIQNVLLDAEEQERLHHGRRSHVESGILERLKEALYQADDLFDEVTTLAHRKKLMPGSLYFSRLIQLRSAFTWSREIKKIREMLDNIVKNHQHDFGLMRHSIDLRVRHNPGETHSFVCEEDVIIGRDEDKRMVMDMLVDTSVQESVSVVSIVGIGGLGKTTLAQQVYNDEWVSEKFPLKMWVCISDDFNVKALVGQILAAANPGIKQDGLSMDQLQMKLRQELEGKKYLLVLDDIWNEDPSKWHELRKLLIGGGKVSRIIVTTRSKKVADVVGSCWTHELTGLSHEASWILFQRMALKPEEYPMKAELIDIGKEIVQKCANVPLAIRVVGSLLRGQEESRWQYLKNTDLANVKQDENNGIVPVLKISYYYLPFHLKSCFSYCAVFPKDYKIIKEDLICLWMAQGFVMPSDGESFEDAGDHYFEQLLQRCFFQDVELAEGTTNEIISFKMHDLIHDLATEVAGTEISSSNYKTRCLNEKTHHISIDKTSHIDILDSLTRVKRLHTFLCIWSPFWVMSLIGGKSSKMKYLRVLCLNHGYSSLRKLPSLIGKMVHLRYLDLSYNTCLLVLPSSITKLYNLQTLKLRECGRLKRLPRDLRKLVNLRHLDIYGCSSLTRMPPGMKSMTSLQKLSGFVVSGTSNAWYWGSAGVDQLVNLKKFTSHSDILEIRVEKGVRYNAVEAREGGFILKSENLRKIKYSWSIRLCHKSDASDNAEALLQGLQPHSNLRTLNLRTYPGVRFPSWGGSSSIYFNNCLPNLVEIEINFCTTLEHLPLMSQLRNLKVLTLSYLGKVEYVESSSNINGGDDNELVFFPSLEKLTLWSMRNLKGWWMSASGSGKGETPEAAKLSYIDIRHCPKLTTFPFCSELEELKLIDFNEALGPIMRETTHASSSSSLSNNKNRQQKEDEEQQGRLREVEIDNVAYLNSLPIHHLSNLKISSDQKLEGLSTGEVFGSGRLSSLRSLDIFLCKKLKSISGRGVWEHFTALETLKLKFLVELELEDGDYVSSNESTEEGCNNEGGDAEMPWTYLAPTLRSLELSGLPKVVKLPKGIGCLSSLQSLNIQRCKNLETLTPSIGGLSSLQSLRIDNCFKLKSVPEETRHLTSLTQLHITGCSPELKKRCENHNGATWANIQHIPRIIVRTTPDSKHCWRNCFGQ